MIKKILIFCSCTLFLACPQKDDGVYCTEEFVYGLSITVTVSGEYVTEGITVTATDGTYSEELMSFPEGTNFVGAGERPGTYVINITSEIYQEFNSELIQVDADACHVIPEVRTFELQPL